MTTAIPPTPPAPHDPTPPRLWPHQRAALDAALASFVTPASGGSGRADRPWERADELDRYDGGDPERLRQVRDEDPVRWVADHVAVADRRAGAIVIALIDPYDGSGCINVVESPPRRPEPDECRAVLRPFVHASAATGHDVALVTHRDGPHVVDPVDERYHAALLQVCAEHDVRALGHAVRLPSGDLLRLPGSR